MKPANFPERKNLRRKGALERMAARKQTPRWQAEYLALSSSIVTDARDVRTKKWRGAGLKPA